MNSMLLPNSQTKGTFDSVILCGLFIYCVPFDSFIPKEKKVPKKKRSIWMAFDTKWRYRASGKWRFKAFFFVFAKKWGKKYYLIRDTIQNGIRIRYTCECRSSTEGTRDTTWNNANVKRKRHNSTVFGLFHSLTLLM